MTEAGSAAGAASRETAQVSPDPRGGRLERRQEDRDDTPLLVEVAWLVIETATAISRLRRILTRL